MFRGHVTPTPSPPPPPRGFLGQDPSQDLSLELGSGTELKESVTALPRGLDTWAFPLFTSFLSFLFFSPPLLPPFLPSTPSPPLLSFLLVFLPQARGLEEPQPSFCMKISAALFIQLTARTAPCQARASAHQILPQPYPLRDKGTELREREWLPQSHYA